MAFTVENLIGERGKPVTVVLENTLQEALSKMFEYEYSQLPVIDTDEKPIGIVTSDAIVRALNHFGVAPQELRVSDVMVKKPAAYRNDDELFDLLDGLKTNSAVFIVDAEGKLTGVVTSYDATEYLQRRSQDIMYVQSIETYIKGFIGLAFTDSTGGIDNVKLSAAIDDINSSDSDLKAFKQALVYYLQKSNGNTQNLSAVVAQEAFTQKLNPKQIGKTFDKLTLYEYIELFLHKDRWDFYKDEFKVDPQAIKKLLNAVRLTRNDLAHFKDTITSHQRQELQFCMDWLSRHEAAFVATLANKAPQTVTVTDPVGPGPEVVNPPTGDEDTKPVAITPPEKPVNPKENRYAPLGRYLRELALEQNSIELTFDQIETIIVTELPPSARQNRAAWANDSVSHVQSREWLDAGWRVSRVNMSSEKVVFERALVWQKAYIAFYSNLLSDLYPEGNRPDEIPTPHGYSNQIYKKLSKETGQQIASLAFAFGSGNQFRIELFIDTNNPKKNLSIFMALAQHRASIESEMGESLAWEPREGRQATKIALYREGSIDKAEETLAELRTWAKTKMLKFQAVIEKWLPVALAELEKEQEPEYSAN